MIFRAHGFDFGTKLYTKLAVTHQLQSDCMLNACMLNQIVGRTQ